MKLAEEQIAELVQKAEDADSTPLQDGLSIPAESPLSVGFPIGFVGTFGVYYTAAASI